MERRSALAAANGLTLEGRPTDTMLVCLLSVFYFPEAVFVGVHCEADWATPIFDSPAGFHY